MNSHIANENDFAGYEFGDLLLGVIAILIPLIALPLLFLF